MIENIKLLDLFPGWNGDTNLLSILKSKVCQYTNKNCRAKK